MNSNETSNWGPLRTVVWFMAAVIMAAVFGPRLVEHMRPRMNETGVELMDFSQEWLSARNYLTGAPVYSDQTEALFRHTGIVPLHPEDMLPWNAHPPAAVLLTLAFGHLDYPHAHFLWNLLTLPLFLLGVALIIQELHGKFEVGRLFAMSVVLLFFTPLYSQLGHAQFNCLLMFLLTAAWVADRRGCVGWAGAAVGLATALKLFPGFVFAYFLFTGRFKAVLTGAAAFLAVNLAALAVLGPHEFATYVRVVLPSVSSNQSLWGNSSLSGHWLRLFDPNPIHRTIPLFSSALLARTLIAASVVLLIAGVAFACRKADSVASRDRAFALTLVAMVLASPVAWNHYIVMLMLPIWLVWLRTPAGAWRLLMWLALLDIWLPHNVVLTMVISRDQAAALIHDRHQPLTPVFSLLVASLYTYALVSLYLLVLVSPSRVIDSTLKKDAVDLDRRLFGVSVNEDAPAAVEPARTANKMADSRSRQEHC